MDAKLRHIFLLLCLVINWIIVDSNCDRLDVLEKIKTAHFYRLLVLIECGIKFELHGGRML